MSENFEEIKQKAENGDKGAQTTLGWIYWSGKDVQRDYEKAFYWYQKAAEQGYYKGQHGLAALYFNGLGIEKNYEKAFHWYQKSEH